MAAADVWGALLGLAIGLVVAFAGYRLARGLAWLAGFLAGASLGLLLGALGGPVVALVAALLVGIVFAIVATFAFRFLGVLLGLAAGVALGAHLGWPTWGTAVAAVLGATIGIVANKPILVTATALLGASLAVGSGLDLVGVGWSPLDAIATEALLLVVVAALGALVQWRSVRHEED